MKLIFIYPLAREVGGWIQMYFYLSACKGGRGAGFRCDSDDSESCLNNLKFELELLKLES